MVEDIILDGEYDKLIKDAKTVAYETREMLQESGTPISQDELSAFEKALKVSDVNRLTQDEKNKASRQANKILKTFTDAKKKMGRALALYIVCSLIAVGSVFGATCNLISYENDIEEVKQIAISEKGIQQEYNKKIEGVKTQFDSGDITKDEYIKKIEDVNKSFDYKYLKNAVIHRAQSQYAKNAVKDLDSDAGLKLRGTIAGYLATAAALGVAIDASSKKKKYSNKLKLMQKNKIDSENLLKCINK